MTNNQKIFCQEYVKNGSNAKQAYLKAYKCKKEKTAESNSIRLLGNARVKEYISQLQKRAETKAIMSTIERKEWLTNLITKEIANHTDKLRALDILNKMDGEYVEKRINTEVSYEDFLKKTIHNED